MSSFRRDEIEEFQFVLRQVRLMRDSLNGGCNMATPKEIIKEVISLSPAKQAELLDLLIRVLDKPDENIDKLWAEEAESRLDAYQRGELRALSVEEVLSKYK